MDEPRGATPKPIDPALAVLLIGVCGALWLTGRWLSLGGDLGLDDGGGMLPFLSLAPPLPADTEAARWAIGGGLIELLALGTFAGVWLRARGRRAGGVVFFAVVVGARALVGIMQAFGVGAR